MENENEKLETSSFDDALAELERVKASSVSRDRYETEVATLKEQNKKLIHSLANDRPVSYSTKEDEPSREERFKRLEDATIKLSKRDSGLDNLTYIKEVNEYRQNYIALTGKDPFYRENHFNTGNAPQTIEDLEKAEASAKRVGDFFEMAAQSESQAELNMLYDRHVIDPKLPNRGRK